MAEHRVTLKGDRIELSPVFNAAVPFIDRHLAEGRGERVAIRTTAGQSVTYAELAERVNRCGRLLLERGLGPGDRLLMVIKDAPEFFYVFWGAIKAGIVPVPLNTLLRAGDFAYIAENSEARGLVYSPVFGAEVVAALERLTTPPAVVLVTEGGADSLLGLLDGAPADLSAVAQGPDDDCFWLYSSGSTGRPKGVVHVQRAMVVTSQRYAVGILGVTEADVCYSAAKLFHAYGLGNAMTFPLWVGGTAVLDAERPTPAASLANIERFRPSLFFGVPTLYGGQLQALAGSQPDLGSLRGCISAGEALPGALFERWVERTGVPVLDGIGSTEALHIFISNRFDDARPNCSGRVVPGYQASIRNDDGGEVGAGEGGLLWIQGDSTAKRYWNLPERTAATMVDGWLRTGDRYVQDEEGRYVYQGRSDDMLKVSGIWCSPFEIEARLMQHPAVLEAAVVGREDQHGLIKPEAFVVLTDASRAGEAMERELLEHCKRGLTPHMYPRWMHFIGELPKTATGKVLRYVLRQGGTG